MTVKARVPAPNVAQADEWRPPASGAGQAPLATGMTRERIRVVQGISGSQALR